MKPYLTKLSSGRYALEFTDDDRRALTAAIDERFGWAEIEALHGASICRFGGESFTLFDQSGEPCLISSSEHGDYILKRLLDDLEPPTRTMPRGRDAEQSLGLGQP